MLQGVSVLAMVCLHLFDRDYRGLFTPILFAGGVPMSFYFGQLSDFCVFGFAFLSGYAHMMQHGQAGYYQRRLKGLLSVFCSYWLILIVFSIVGIMIGQGDYMPGSLKKFILNGLALENSYNGAWWYMLVYAVLVFISPVMLKLNQKMNPGVLFALSLLGYAGAAYFRSYSGIDNQIVAWLALFGVTLFEYLSGAIVYKAKLLTRLSKIDGKLCSSKGLTVLKYSAFALVYITMLLFHSLVIGSIAVAPFTGFVIILIFHFTKKPLVTERFFLFIGKHSTNIWLTHMFFYLYIFKGLVLIVKYPLFILLFMILLCVITSYVIMGIEKVLYKGIKSIRLMVRK